MLIWEISGMAFKALSRNRLRTSLTTLGIIIGIASVIMVTSIGEGVQAATQEEIKALGTNVMLVLSGATRFRGVSQGTGSANTLTIEDAEAIAQQAPATVGVAPYLQRSGQMVYGDRNTSTFILGVDLQYLIVKEIQPQIGRFFTEEELEKANSVVILGSKIWEELFNVTENPIGTKVRIEGRRYTVIGVMESKGTVGEQDQDDRIYVPLKNMYRRITGNRSLKGVNISGIWIKAKDQIDLEAAQFQVTNLLRIRHDIYPPQPDDFRISNQVDIIKAFDNVVGFFTILISSIAAISLVVGGIGIANIMLVSVVERTKEIGIRKALGATNTLVLYQFLIEAVLVSLLGGILGLGVGVGFAFVGAGWFEVPFIISYSSMGWGMVISIMVGLIAGVLPAANAARLDPIVALRS